MSESSLADVLRKRGLRLTPQRQLVLEAVYELGHATPDQVHAKVARTAAGVNITTVYRTLELLEELGLVTHAHLSHGAMTYHGIAGEQLLQRFERSQRAERHDAQSLGSQHARLRHHGPRRAEHNSERRHIREHQAHDGR